MYKIIAVLVSIRINIEFLKINLKLNIFLVLGPQKYENGFLDDFINVGIFAHFLNELKVKRVSFYFRGKISNK